MDYASTLDKVLKSFDFVCESLLTASERSEIEQVMEFSKILVNLSSVLLILVDLSYIQKMPVQDSLDGVLRSRGLIRKLN